MIKKIMMKLIREMQEPQNKHIRNLMLAEILLFILYFICMILQHISDIAIARQIYLVRWGILFAAVMLWAMFSWREKRWKERK